MHSRRTTPLTSAFVASVLTLACAACNGGQGGEFASYTPNPLGTGDRIAQVFNPASPDYANNGANVNISSAAVLQLDTFDETRNGKSIGTLYMQDVGSSAPYAGVSLYKQTLVPANHTPTPGDVFNIAGAVSKEASVGTAVFGNEYLLQISEPTCQFEYEYKVPSPAVINITDLDSFNTGMQWMSMLVTVHNVKVGTATVDSSNRVTYPLGGGVGDVPTMTNGLYNLGWQDFPSGTTYASVTGIVTWFYNFEIQPRSPEDIVVTATQ